MYQFNLLPDIIRLITATLFAFAIGWTFRRQLFLIAVRNKFYARTCNRSSHTGRVPTIGGTLIFLAYICSFLLFIRIERAPILQYVLLGTMIIFLIGFYDDLANISPSKKFLGELVAVALLIFGGNYYLTDIHGVLGIHDIVSSLGIALTLLIFIGIINAINLIDGINGLASGITTLDTIAFGLWFYQSGNIETAILCGILIGAITPFFIYNVFGTRSRMFMGDSGSLVIGFLMSFLVLYFCENQIVTELSKPKISAPGVAFSIMAVPVLDTIRIMMTRWVYGKSPFSPDKNHFHHRLLVIFNNHHIKVTSVMLCINIVFITIGILLCHWRNELIILIDIILFTVIFLIFNQKANKIEKKQKAKELKTITA